MCFHYNLDRYPISTYREREFYVTDNKTNTESKLFVEAVADETANSEDE
jgi:hypothetical protein